MNDDSWISVKLRSVPIHNSLHRLRYQLGHCFYMKVLMYCTGLYATLFSICRGYKDIINRPKCWAWHSEPRFDPLRVSNSSMDPGLGIEPPKWTWIKARPWLDWGPLKALLTWYFCKQLGLGFTFMPIGWTHTKVWIWGVFFAQNENDHMMEDAFIFNFLC